MSESNSINCLIVSADCAMLYAAMLHPFVRSIQCSACAEFMFALRDKNTGTGCWLSSKHFLLTDGTAVLVSVVS